MVTSRGNRSLSYAILIFSVPFSRGSLSMPAVVNPEKCTGCETCVESCPLDAIAMKEGLAVVDAETCGDCGACVDVCPVEAIAME
jgi:heterodisulfide reductase subunit A-like polyferredoxin